MDWNEYNVLFHKEGLNKIAFKRLMDCDKELISFINTILEQERKEAADHYLKLIRDCVATEREANVKLLEDFAKTNMVPSKDTWRMGLIAGANAIRTRGDKHD